MKNNDWKDRLGVMSVSYTHLDVYKRQMYATPNPARDQVEFFLHHNRPESNLKVTVMVYDMTGKFLWSTEKSGSSELFKAYIRCV